jgi:hypothetical protein
MKPPRRWRIVILAVLAVALPAACVFACPTCKEGLAEADPQQQSLAAGYYYSILFMMSMPYIVLGTFGYVAYRSIQRARGRQDAGDDEIYHV